MTVTLGALARLKLQILELGIQVASPVNSMRRLQAAYMTNLKMLSLRLSQRVLPGELPKD